MVATYPLEGHDGADTSSAGLKSGDCGSWVVDSETNEVYGHIVASDVFGEVYVVPLGAVLEDIRKQLAAEAVVLPPADEVLQEQYRGLKFNSEGTTFADSALDTDSALDSACADTYLDPPFNDPALENKYIDSVYPYDPVDAQPDPMLKTSPKRERRRTTVVSHVLASLKRRRQKVSSATQHDFISALPVASPPRKLSQISAWIRGMVPESRHKIARPVAPEAPVAPVAPVTSPAECLFDSAYASMSTTPSHSPASGPPMSLT